MGYLTISHFSEAFSKFQFSWSLTLFLGIFQETVVPLLCQVFLLIMVQLIGIFADYIRVRLFKKKKDE